MWRISGSNFHLNNFSSHNLLGKVFQRWYCPKEGSKKDWSHDPSINPCFGSTECCNSSSNKIDRSLRIRTKNDFLKNIWMVGYPPSSIWFWINYILICNKKSENLKHILEDENVSTYHANNPTILILTFSKKNFIMFFWLVHTFDR